MKSRVVWSVPSDHRRTLSPASVLALLVLGFREHPDGLERRLAHDLVIPCHHVCAVDVVSPTCNRKPSCGHRHPKCRTLKQAHGSRTPCPFIRPPPWRGVLSQPVPGRLCQATRSPWHAWPSGWQPLAKPCHGRRAARAIGQQSQGKPRGRDNIPSRVDDCPRQGGAPQPRLGEALPRDRLPLARHCQGGRLARPCQAVKRTASRRIPARGRQTVRQHVHDLDGPSGVHLLEANHVANLRELLQVLGEEFGEFGFLCSRCESGGINGTDVQGG